MSHNEHERTHEDVEEDPVEAITRHIPVVIPLMGAALMFLLASIAVGLA